MAEIVNTFIGGMMQDSFESLQPEGTYITALNAVHSSSTRSHFGLVNEESTEKVCTFDGPIVGRSYIEERHQTLFFINQANGSLWLYDHDTKEKIFVCSAAEFGCDWKFSTCELLYGEFKKFNKCKELHVYWSSECIYHVVNIDEMLDRKRKEAVKSLDDACGHFDLFHAICGPHISAIPSKFNGSALEAGSYACAIQLSDTDGNETNIFDIGQFAVASSEDNVGGQISKSSIKFNISSLDKRYNKAIIYIIAVVKGVTNVYKMDSLTYGDKGFTYEYYGQKGELINVATLANKSKAFLRGQDLLQKDGFMLFYSLRNERNLNYQKWANKIQVSYVEYEVSFEQAEKYFFPSLLRGEVYAIGIVWKFCDGTYSPVFHIPGGAASAAAFQEKMSALVSTGDNYKPIEISDLDTSNQFERKRNPSELKDRKNESKKFETAINTVVDNIDTNRDDMVDAAACHDNLYGCDTAEKTMDQDIDDLSDAIESNNELLAGFGLDKPDPDVNTTTNLKDSSLKLIADAVTNREYITRKRPVLNYTGVNQGAPGGSPSTPDSETPEVVISGEVNEMSASTRGDNWVDGAGNNLTDEPPREISSGPMEVYTSTQLYPKDKDCDAEFFYPQGPIRHHRVPWTSSKPHFTSYTNGVENQYQPDNHPYGKTFIRPMGIKLSNIHRPDDSELPKPLCPNSPFKIVYVKRTPLNKSIFAKGYLTGVFNGSNYGVNYAFPRHGVNSFETVDRSISNANNSRMGTPSDDPLYNFHSPDTDADHSFLPINKIKSELKLKGSGWRYGLYAEGKKPENQWTGTRTDNRGARVANNLNHYDPGSGGLVDVEGITFAPADAPATQTSGIKLPLNNRFRESSIYLQAASRMPGDERDQSFVGDVMDHFAPTKCNAPYVALVRDLPDQYGGVEGLRYADLGITATTAHANGATEIKGLCGDTFIGPYSKRRTSYVSNKQGDSFGVPAKPGSPCRERSWCDSPDDKIFEYTGIDYYPTKLPKSGDKYDPKNYAGLHTTGTGCGNAISKTAAAAAAVNHSESDWYGPRTLKSLVHTIVECEVNPYLRETGLGDQRIEGKVHYRNLKGLNLDSEAPIGHFWEDSWLSRFYGSIQQPSLKQLTTKTAIRSFLTLIIPALTLLNFQHLDSLIGPVAALFTASGLSSFWVIGTNTLFTDKRLNEMLRIGDCQTDEEGGDLKEFVTGFENNYTVYNKDFQRVNDIYPYTAFPLPYNTCPCNDCSKDNISQEIAYSNPQNVDSEIDAYKNVKVNNYLGIQGHQGGLKRLFILNGQLWAHLTKGLAMIKLNPIQMSSDIVLQQSGDGQLLTEPQLLYEGVSEGVGGTTHPNASISTPMGYWFIDDKAQKLYLFNGSLEEISSYGMFHFFKNNLDFCTKKECYDEKSADDNHYSLGWDPRYNRLLLTKYDGDLCNSFTISYDPLSGKTGKWISFHSYTPQDYLWDKKDLYSIVGDSLYRHGVQDSYLNFYGESQPFMVETSAAFPDAFRFESFSLDTLAERGDKEGLDITFNKMAIYNSTQGTGTLDVELISDDKGKVNDQFTRSKDNNKLKVHAEKRRFTSNGVFNLIKDDCDNQALVIKECECSPITTINDSIFDCKKLAVQNYKGRDIYDDHLIYRLILDGDNTTRLYLKKLKTKIVAP